MYEVYLPSLGRKIQINITHMQQDRRTGKCYCRKKRKITHRNIITKACCTHTILHLTAASTLYRKVCKIMMMVLRYMKLRHVTHLFLAHEAHARYPQGYARYEAATVRGARTPRICFEELRSECTVQSWRDISVCGFEIRSPVLRETPTTICCEVLRSARLSVSLFVCVHV